MKCIHCHRDTPASVFETRKQDDRVYRGRRCGHCSQSFITVEAVCPTQAMPKRTEDYKEKQREGRRMAKERPKLKRSAPVDLLSAWRVRSDQPTS
jgi:transcriptional regulator NrdR family protein